MFCSAIQYSFGVRPVSAHSESANFEGADGKKHAQEKAILDQEKQRLVHVKDRRSSNRNLGVDVFIMSAWSSMRCTFDEKTWKLVVCFE